MMKKRQAEASKYHVVSVSPDEEHCITCYETKEDLVESIEQGGWDEYEFTDILPLWGNQAYVIKGTIVVPKVTRRAVEVEIE